MSDYSPIQILYVEDDRDTYDLIKLILTQHGFNVLIAETMEKAFSVIQNQRVSLCILEGKLPDGNGTDLCRRIKEFDESISVVFYSAAVRISDIDAARAAGADEYLTKPSGWDNLVETVNGMLKLRHPHLADNLIAV